MSSIDLLPGEIFRPVVGRENRYMVSNEGRVMSLSAEYKSRTLAGNGLLTPVLCRGYLRVNIYDDNAKITPKAIHRLVATAFLGDPVGERRFVNHIDGNKLNNRLCNLEWVTAKENVEHATRTGLRNNRGSSSAVSRLIEADIVGIRAMRMKGITMPAIGARFGVSEGCIGNILRGRTWTHVPHESEGMPSVETEASA